ncbi:MAG: 1-deoxy-D-xylulose-5-phosphate reductoisomerase [Ignavibacteriaceae bacterium]|nr:1-deoxy-D-xylulose-5-phosphate reductoisomerase [Ignavibacteriaceae bacterium]
MKKIAILGSTGSIGFSSVDVIRNLEHDFKITALTVNTKIELLLPQIKEFNPEVVAVRDRAKAAELRKLVDCTVLEGDEGLIELAATADYDIFIGAMVGFSGLAPTLEAIKRGKRIALANKETLVVAGELVTQLCEKYGAELLPVDSEHSAVFQSLSSEQSSNIKKIILTASGGPFFKVDKNEFNSITVEQALNHPTWKMGAKISIDSATMMNKGLEVIEAKWLFNVACSQIEVVIHPQSVIHSMVEFIDGSVKAQLSVPDMKLPIQYALTYPGRMPANFVNNNFPKIGTLTFFEPDMSKFECLGLAFESLKTGGTAPCIINAANEIAVEKFLNKQISFSRIPGIIKDCLNKIENHKTPCLETIFETDRLTRELALGLT